MRKDWPHVLKKASRIAGRLVVYEKTLGKVDRASWMQMFGTRRAGILCQSCANLVQ
jgi:hypothetical protein